MVSHICIQPLHAPMPTVTKELAQFVAIAPDDPKQDIAPGDARQQSNMATWQHGTMADASNGRYHKKDSMPKGFHSKSAPTCGTRAEHIENLHWTAVSFK